MAYITNGGAKLIQRAVQEKKALVFGSVRMNSIYESTPSELVQKSDSWFGANIGEVVGCLSHVSVDDVLCVRDAKIAIQCNDNTKPWKSIGIYAHLEGEDDELLFACESIQNGDYKNVTIVELPVTLDGAVEDFGLSEGGGGGGGGGDVPANMMTTNTAQEGLSGMKQWLWQIYEGQGTEDKPQEGDMQKFKILSIGSNIKGGDLPDPIVFNSTKREFVNGAWRGAGNSIVVLDASGVTLQGGSDATWDRIINAANRGVTDTHVGQGKVEEEGGNLMVFGEPIQPNKNIPLDGILLTFDSSGYLESVSNISAGVATIGVIVCDQRGGTVANGRVSGVSMDGETPISFQSPIPLEAGYTITYQAFSSSF